MRNFFVRFFTICFIFSQLINVASGFSIAAEAFELELTPGQTYTSSIRVTNPDDAFLNIDVVVDAVMMNESGRRLKIDETSPEYAGGTFLKNWIKISPTQLSLDAGEAQTINVTIDVPEEVSPGRYHAIITMREVQDASSEGGGSSVGVSTAIAKTIDVFISGDMERNVELKSFQLDKVAEESGNMVFISKFLNTGGISENISARIEIYDDNDEQIKAITKTVEEDGTIQTADSLPVSFSSQYIFPGVDAEIKTEWINRNLKAGDYTAKLLGYWGADGNAIYKELPVSIKENIRAEFSSDTFWYQSLPAKFSGKIVNEGSRGVKYNSKLIIKNLFGVGIYEKDITENNGMLLGDKESPLSSETAIWDAGFAMGPHTAVLQVAYGDSNNILEVSTTFFVMTWWQIILTILVLALVVFGIYKGVHAYRNLKKKINKLESSEKS